MPLIINVGLSRKHGQKNFGSRGVALGLQVEADAQLVDQPQQLQMKIERLFEMVNQSLNLELSKQSRLVDAADADACLIHQHPIQIRFATTKQLRAIRMIATRFNLDLQHELRARFGERRLEDLTIHQASQMIDELTSAVGLRDNRRGQLANSVSL